MRKQDRILQQKNQNAEEQHESDSPQSRPSEEVKGSASEKPNRPPRQPGRLPLPE